MDTHTSFYFLRHGQTQWNKDKIVQGQIDSQLNATGRAQAQNAAEILANEPIARIIASPLSRARHTAEAVAAKHNIDIIFDDALMECHLGDHQGEAYADWVPHYWTGDYTPPNGESFADFSKRVWDAMQQAIARGPNTLIVAHGGLWIAAKQFAAQVPEMDFMPNALPLIVTQNQTQWSHRTLGE